MGRRAFNFPGWQAGLVEVDRALLIPQPGLNEHASRRGGGRGEKGGESRGGGEREVELLTR